jgi:CRP/FNR family transcriptional regulator
MMLNRNAVMSVTSETIAGVPAFRNLSRATRCRLAEEATLLSFASGEVLYRHGDPVPGLYALLAGRVKLFRQSKERMQIFSILSPGECFGAESLPDDGPTACSATALTMARALYVSPDALRGLVLDCPDFQVMLLEVVSIRLRQFVSLVHNLAFRDVSARLASALLALGETDGEPSDDGLRIHRLLTQQELAAMVGTAREVIHRTLKKFERDGLVRVTPTHFLLLDTERLGEIARHELR